MGLALPPIGLGTGGPSPLEGAQGEAIVADALEAGYRHIDTAQSYENEATVGRGLDAADVDRSAVTVATKVARGNLRRADVSRSVQESIDRLGVETVDLLYVHFPTETYRPKETLPAFDDLVDEGLARHIGVSNFSPAEVEEALDIAAHPIVANQIEMHPLCQQEDMVAFLQERGMQAVAFSPLAQGAVFDVPEILDVAEKHDASPAQVTLAWLAQKDGVVAIPKTGSRTHLQENLSGAEMELDQEDVALIDSIDRTETVWSWTPDDGGWTVDR